VGDAKYLGTDVIDQLVEEQLARGNRDCTTSVGQPMCDVCRGDWHGAAIDDWHALGGFRICGCPGAFATDEQRQLWQDSWAYEVLRKAGIVRGVRVENTEPLTEPRTDPWPSDFCPLCGGDWHDAPLQTYTVFDEGHLPSCPGSRATEAQHQRWLWQCSFRCCCEHTKLEAELDSLGYNAGQTNWLEYGLPCGGG
jgi:hypothetical protein